jgi:hypothetical protein
MAKLQLWYLVRISDEELNERQWVNWVAIFRTALAISERVLVGATFRDWEWDFDVMKWRSVVTGQTRRLPKRVLTNR